MDGKETGISVIKSLFGAVPYAGTMLNEIAFDYRSRVKQNRLNTFTSLLAEFFTDKSEIDIATLKTEEFSDIFESVIRRVVLTKSKEKHARFRDVLIKQIYAPHQEIESAETYLDLISSLDEMAICILAEHARFSADFLVLDELQMKAEAGVRQTEEAIRQITFPHPKDDQEIANLNIKLAQESTVAKSIRQQITDRQDFRKAAYFQITEAEFLYYKQSLYAKALLIDKGFGTHGGSTPFLRMWTTKFGEEFIQFLKA